MRRINLFSSLFLLLLSAGQGIAQDEKVHQYMRAITDQFKLDQAYKLEVDYIREDIMQETSVRGDALIWMKGLMYKMSVNEYIIYFDGQKQYSQNTDIEEVYVSTPDPDKASYLEAVPIRAIRSYQQNFRYQYMGLRPFQGKNLAEVQLYPLEPGGPYSMLKLFVNPSTMKLAGFVLKHKEGIHYTMILNSVQHATGVTDDTFRFIQEEYPDTEVIELMD